MTTTPGLDAYLASRSDRCEHGFHTATQHGFCPCTPTSRRTAPGPPTAPVERITSSCSSASEWDVFVAALRQCVDAAGEVHQSAMRPLIRGRIAPKHIASFYRKARTDGLIADTGRREPSNDVAGRNTDKLDRIYALVGHAERTAA